MKFYSPIIKDQQQIPSLAPSPLKDQWYRFFIDADLLSSEGGYSAYEDREPGAVASGKKAMDYVFSILENDVPAVALTEETIRSLHVLVKGHQEGAGVYRDKPTGLFIVCKARHLERVDLADAQALKNFIPKSWSGACVSLAHFADITFHNYITPAVKELKPCNDAELEAFFSKTSTNAYLDTFFYRAPDSASISQLVSASCAQYNQSILQIASIAKIFMKNAAYKDPETIEDFKQALNRALFRVIVQLAKEVDLMHPFSDGNTRTALILMQRELVRHGFLPAIIADPNLFETLSVDEFIDKQLLPGLENTQILSKTPDAIICGYAHTVVKNQVSDFSIFKEEKVINPTQFDGVTKNYTL